MPARIDEPVELVLQFGQLTESIGDLIPLGLQQHPGVGARRITAIANDENASDLGECEPRSLGGPDESEATHGLGVVVAVPGSSPVGLGKDAPPLVKANGAAGHTGDRCQLSDQHERETTP